MVITVPNVYLTIQIIRVISVSYYEHLSNFELFFYNRGLMLSLIFISFNFYHCFFMKYSFVSEKISENQLRTLLEVFVKFGIKLLIYLMELLCQNFRNDETNSLLILLKMLLPCLSIIFESSNEKWELFRS